MDGSVPPTPSCDGRFLVATDVTEHEALEQQAELAAEQVEDEEVDGSIEDDEQVHHRHVNLQPETQTHTYTDNVCQMLSPWTTN